MIPISDINPAKNVPVISRIFIIFSSLTFLFLQPKNNIDLLNYFYKYAAIPCELINNLPISDLFKIKGFFDIIILDAPCSATGTVRRHPDLPYVKSQADLKKLFCIQYSMLEHAVSLMKPTTQLVYCTCSLFPQEGEYQVRKLLYDKHEIRVEKYLPKELDFLEKYRTEEGGLRLLPIHLAKTGGIDGFYICLLYTSPSPRDLSTSRMPSSA